MIKPVVICTMEQLQARIAQAWNTNNAPEAVLRWHELEPGERDMYAAGYITGADDIKSGRMVLIEPGGGPGLVLTATTPSEGSA